MATVRSTEDRPLDPQAAFVALGSMVVGEHSLESTLQQVAGLAKDTVPGADEVSVTLVTERPATAAFTGQLALDLDETQYEKGFGPCLAASEGHPTLVITDMTTEDRWPEFARRAAEKGVLSFLSVGLPVQQRVIGALNVYARRADAFDPGSVELAQRFASYAAVAVANASAYSSTARLAEQMQAAMQSRAVIDQAKGIIMGQRRCNADEAFEILIRASNVSNKKLRDLAQAIVDGVEQGEGGR